MRHRKSVGRKSFGRTHSQKNATLKNLVFALIEHGRIKTTLAKAKELRRHAEKLITLGKKRDLHARRLLLSRYPNKQLIADVFNRLAPKFLGRDGGYTRIVKIGNRIGDHAQMAFVEWVESDLIVEKAEKAKPKKKPKVKKPPQKVEKIDTEEAVIEKPKRRWFWSAFTPRTKGILVALILIALFVGVGLFVRSCMQSQQMEHNKDALSQLEDIGAMDFSLPHVEENRLVSLSEFKGMVTIVNFWATWCSPCVEEFESMLQLLEEFQGQIQILAVSLDQDKSDVLNFLKAFEVTNPYLVVLHDPEGTLAKKWGTWKLPESYILNRDQKLVKKVASSENWSTPIVFHYFNDIIQAGLKQKS